MCGIRGLKATHAKETNYHYCHPLHRFLALEVEIFGCLHKCKFIFFTLKVWQKQLWDSPQSNINYVAFVGFGVMPFWQLLVFSSNYGF